MLVGRWLAMAMMIVGAIDMLYTCIILFAFFTHTIMKEGDVRRDEL